MTEPSQHPDSLSDNAPYTRAEAERFVTLTYHEVRASMARIHIAVAEHNVAAGLPAYAPLFNKGTPDVR